MSESSTRTSSIRFDLRVYRLSAIKVADYKFSDSCSANISIKNETTAIVELTLANQAIDVNDLLACVCNEVLDQDLRESIRDETTSMRNLLLAQAFSNTNLLDEIGGNADFSTDPLGIGILSTE